MVTSRFAVFRCLRVIARVAISALVCSALFGATAEYSETWQYSKTADPMQGGSIAIASVSGGGVQALVRCWTTTGELDVSFLLTHGGYRADSDSITIGFDERRDAERTWRVSSNGLALVVPSAQRSKLLRRMRDAGNMRISLATSDESMAHLQVPLRGSSRAIRSVMQVCK